MVPVKRFAAAKSRLAGVLSNSARTELARALCEHVLETVAACDDIAGALVATDCDDVEAFAMARGAAVLRDGAERSLSAIVDRALADVATRGATRAIVLMSDLPRLAARDVAALSRALHRCPMVLAPDRVDHGTNALGLGPPEALGTCFGTGDSFRRHIERARGAGLGVEIYRSDGVACDVDTAEDLARLAPYASRGGRLRWNRKRPSRVSPS